MKKLRSRSGETLIETMAALIVIVLSIGIIATASAVCVKINKTVRDNKIEFTYSQSDTVTSTALVKGTTNGKQAQIQVSVYTDNDFKFYEKK